MMEGETSTHRTAVVSFGSAGEAERRVAGVPAAARVARELAEAGFAEAWFVLDAGGTPDPKTRAEIDRLAGGMSVRLTDAAPPPGALPSGAVRVSGKLIAGTIRLDAPGASMAILKRTGKDGDGPVSRWLNRPVSRRISALLLRVPGMRPIHATVGTALLAATMFAALIAGGPAGLVAGGLLFQAASVFDGVDGEIARATYRTSAAGASLDTLIDAATNLLFILGVTFNLATRGAPYAVPLGGWGLALFAIGLAAIARRQLGERGAFRFEGVKQHYQDHPFGPLARRVIRLLTIVSSRDFFALLFALLIVVGLPMAVLWIFAAAATVWIPFVAVSLLGPASIVSSRPSA